MEPDEFGKTVHLATGGIQSQFALGLSNRPEVTTREQGAVQDMSVTFPKTLFERNQDFREWLGRNANVPNVSRQSDGSPAELEHRARRIFLGRCECVSRRDGPSPDAVVAEAELGSLESALEGRGFLGHGSLSEVGEIDDGEFGHSFPYELKFTGRIYNYPYRYYNLLLGWPKTYFRIPEKIEVLAHR